MGWMFDNVGRLIAGCRSRPTTVNRSIRTI
jgi:hypothetical protein